MAVAVDHDVEPGGFGLQVELAHVVEHIDRDAFDFNYFSFGQDCCPWSVIYIPPDGSDGS